jgi:acyl carrier protein
MGGESSRATYEGLLRIWSEVLNVDRITSQDTFFSLGGNSLLAVRMLVRVAAEFDTEFDYERFFQNPTIEALSVLLEDARGGRLIRE